MVVHTCNVNTVEQEDQKFKVTFNYTVSSRLVWDTQDPVSNKKKKTNNMQTSKQANKQNI